jgi:hypothetical protein
VGVLWQTHVAVRDAKTIEREVARGVELITLRLQVSVCCAEQSGVPACVTPSSAPSCFERIGLFMLAILMLKS